MSDEKKTNLEPVDERDEGLAEKFGHIEKGSFSKKKEARSIEPVFDKKEFSKESSSIEKDDSYNKILTKIKSKSNDDNKASIAEDAKTISMKADVESQVNQLINLAMTKDVVHAVKVAKHLEDNYVLDMFHDKLLADELHDALSEKGLI